MIKKIMKKTTAIIMAAACVITMSGCGGKGNDSKSSELAEGVYRFEEKTLVTEKDAITSSFYLKGNELYYQYYAYAEFPEEYYEDLNKIQDDSDDIARTETVIEDGSTESLATDENSSDSESDSKDKETSSNDGISDDNISDDDLLGNIDDMFGDDADKDDASADNSGDEQKGEYIIRIIILRNMIWKEKSFQKISSLIRLKGHRVKNSILEVSFSTVRVQYILM